MGFVLGAGFVLAIVFMVMFHEFGHYITAKRYGMKVTEFYFGFGPRLWSKRPVRVGAGGEEIESETEYGFKAIPAGGYVRITGMNPLEEIDPADEHRTFRGKPAPQKLVVLAAGSTTHFITGFLLWVAIFAVVGLPGAPIPVLDRVPPPTAVGGAPTPAMQAGLQPGDRIVEFAGTPVTTWVQVTELIRLNAGKEVTIVVERGSRRERVASRTTLGTREDGTGFLGVVASVPTERKALPIAVRDGAYWTWRSGYDGVRGFLSFFTPSKIGSYVGALGGADPKSINDEVRPVSLYGAGRIATQSRGLADFMILIAVITIFVGVINLLPFFPLDGGWIAVVLYERVLSLIKRRPVEVDFRRLVPLTYAVVMVLGFLFVTSLYLDITNPIL